MKIIGLTGGIACGKSTVSKALRALGACIIDADALAHELSQPNQALFNAYVQRFGMAIVTPGGTLDRAAIARLIFTDPTMRAEVEQISHPLIRRAVEERLRMAEKDKKEQRYSMCRCSLRQDGMRLPMRSGWLHCRQRSSLRVFWHGIRR